MTLVNHLHSKRLS